MALKLAIKFVGVLGFKLHLSIFKVNDVCFTLLSMRIANLPFRL